MKAFALLFVPLSFAESELSISKATTSAFKLALVFSLGIVEHPSGLEICSLLGQEVRNADTHWIRKQVALLVRNTMYELLAQTDL